MANWQDNITGWLHDDPLRRSVELANCVVVDVLMDADELVLKLAHGRRLSIADEGQQCCEHRYMSCDDDPRDLIGGTLVSIEVVDGPGVPNDPESDGCHDAEFLKVSTTKGSITVVNHNEHNGYYGGFNIVMTLSNEGGAI